MEDKCQIRSERQERSCDRLMSNPMIREKWKSVNLQIESSSSFLYIMAIPPLPRKCEQCVDVSVDSVRV